MIAALPFRPTLPRNAIRQAFNSRTLGTLPSQFPAPNPQGSPSPFVNAIATAIASQEGYGASNSACTALNNPGCLTAGPGQVGTQNGFAVFSDPASGWNALDSQIQTNIDLGLNFQSFFAGQPGVYGGYAPTCSGPMCAGNNPSAYASSVAGQVGVDTSTPLSQLQASYDASNGGTVAPSVDVFGSNDGADSGGSSLSVGGVDLTPFLIAAGVIFAAMAMR